MKKADELKMKQLLALAGKCIALRSIDGDLSINELGLLRNIEYLNLDPVNSIFDIEHAKKW